VDTQRKLEVLHTPDRLESWKEIAAYLNRSERTVRRWEEREGLPVHRLQHDKRGSVYAYARQLDAWRESRRQLVEAEQPDRVSSGTSGGWKTASWVGAGVASILLVVTLAWLANRSTTAAPTPNPEAVRLVQRALFRDNPGRVQIETAIRTYREAIRIDPTYAPAWSGLATAHLALGWFGEAPVAETIPQARSEAQEAMRIDPTLGAPWRVLAFASHFFDYDHSTAEKQFRRAIELRPDDATALSWFGDFWADLRKFDEARQYYMRAQAAAPRWLEPMTFAANVHYFTGHLDLAIAEYERVLGYEPGFGFANHFLGRAQLAAGRLAPGVERLRKSDELLGRVPFSRSDLGYALAVSGRRSEAEEILADMMRRRSEGYYPAFAIAVVLLGLGETEMALDWLERAVDERHVGFCLPTVDPLYDVVRAHPRFRRVLERINIAP
jgi:tetratricopeptide (TPR) repeat protein